MMRRLVALLIVIGVNVSVASLAGAFWHASFECAQRACDQGAVGLFIELLFSMVGLLYWFVIAVGLLVVWRGVKLRQR